MTEFQKKEKEELKEQHQKIIEQLETDKETVITDFYNAKIYFIVINCLSKSIFRSL